MNHLPEIFLQIARTAAAMPRRLTAALTLALLTTACGPGSGGTGVGPIAGSYLTFASSGGTSLAVTTGLPSGASFVATFDQQGIHLLGSCLAFSFDGAWAESNGEARATGSYRSVATGSDLGAATAITATLFARSHADGLSIRVLDSKGATLASFEFTIRLADGSHPALPPPCTSLLASPSPPSG